MSPVLTRMFSKTRDRVMAVAMLVITALVLGFAPQAMAQTNPTAQSLPYSQNFDTTPGASGTT